MISKVPVTTLKQLITLRSNGDLERIYQWIAVRVREFCIQLDTELDFGHAGFRMERGHVVRMLKRDLRNAIAKGQFPYLSNTVIEHCVVHTLKRLVAEAKKEMEAMENERERA